MNAKTSLLASLLLVLAPLVSACDPYPVVDFRNGTTSTLALRWHTPISVELETYPMVMKPAHKTRLWASRAFSENNLVITAEGCDYVYPALPAAIEYGYGRVNNLLVTPDMRLQLYGIGSFLDLRPRKGESQPPGWPVSPISRTCR